MIEKGAFDRCVGIFAGDAVCSNSTVNILGTNLGHAVNIDRNKATMSLGTSQGSSNADYARAFAFGNGVHIDISGQIASGQ
jgi:hypothetical protein